MTSEGNKPLAFKVEAVVNIKKPKTVQDLRRFLTMVNFYKRFLPQAADKQKILHSF